MFPSSLLDVVLEELILIIMLVTTMINIHPPTPHAICAPLNLSQEV
jgi:hypothetical protein